MQTFEYLNCAKKALAEQGIIGARATRLIEEWNDHLECEIGTLVDSGQQRSRAIQTACNSLGKPGEIARIATTQLIQSSWQGRHPWISASVIYLFLALIGAVACTMSGGLLIENWHRLGGEASLPFFSMALRALPWSLGLIWVAWYARHMPGGWKGFWIVASFTGLALPIVDFGVFPSYKSPGSGTITFGLSFSHSINALCLAITFSLAAIIWWRAIGFPRIRSGQRIATTLAILCLSGCAIPGKRQAMNQAMDRLSNGQIKGIPNKAEFTYSFPATHKGPYSKVDRHNMVYRNPDGTGGQATLFFGKSRENSDWEVFLLMIKGHQPGQQWTTIPIDNSH